MLNSDIFNFEFVDRKSERDSVDNFLTDCQNSENVLWLSGKQGIGKSFFFCSDKSNPPSTRTIPNPERKVIFSCKTMTDATAVTTGAR